MYGMANGVDVEWVRAAKPGEPSKPSEDLEAELRELRDEVRRLREQVAALAVESARPAPGDERLPTYVGRLDASLEGGGPRGSVIAITGPGGSMKTSLGLYILIKNRSAGRPGVYVTVEESRESILRTRRHHGLRTPLQRRGRGPGPTPIPMREDAPHEPFSRLLRPDVRQRVRGETVRSPEVVPLAPADVIRRRP